jgi:hypothetical protein
MSCLRINLRALADPEAMFQLTVMGMKSEEEAVALQAIEFWTSVAEEEAQLEADFQDAAEVCKPSSFLITSVLKYVCRGCWKAKSKSRRVSQR